MKRIASRTILAALLSLVALCSATGAFGATRLEQASLTDDGTVTRLRLQASGPVQFSDFSLTGPDRIVVDCWDVEGAPSLPKFRNDLVQDVSFVRMNGENGPTTRMVVSLARSADYTVSQRQSALEVSIQPGAPKDNAGLVEAGGSRGSRVSLDVQGADVKTVLRTLSEASGRNIVPARDVKGEVSLSLRNVAWRDALNSLCRAHGLGYKEENGIIRVAPLELIQNEDLNAHAAERKAEDMLPLETRTVHISFANVGELKAPLTSTLSKRGRVDADERTSTLLITDIPERAEAAEKLAASLDSRTPQITITAKLIDVDASCARDLGITWNSSHTGGTVGVDPAVKAGLGESSGSIKIGLLSPDSHVFNLKLEALERERKANVISNPTITTVDNREARIVVGQKIPLIVADAAGNAITQLQTIGIQMRVTPHLNADNKITMDIHPEVSDLSTQATVQGGVIINTSEADTRVLVEDGATAVIGGLIRTNESTFITGVPVLKDIPVLGHLFRSSNKTTQKRELIILVTPHLVTGNPGK
ncbi:MAG: AMIN domain-containing protein [Candidatus Eisenbacteria bacterium]|nr:AMIN domain-containing protein [Candidatus Eisenbacteria bacterium]